MESRRRPPDWLRLACWSLAILVLNALIARKSFSEEYPAYLSSIEGTFIAIARQIAAHPRDLFWFPFWDCGLPFQNTYLPLLPSIVGAFSRLSGHSAALSYHQVTAAFFCCSGVGVLLLAWFTTRSESGSVAAALAYSLVSPSAFLIPAIRNDLGSVWRLRRLHVLVFYGEGPPTASMALLPLAILFLYLALTRKNHWIRIAAGALAGFTVLANAFGGTLIGMATLCLLCSINTERIWRNLALLSVIGLLACCWISPLFPPSVFAAIRMNSPTVGGDFRPTMRTFAGAAILAIGFIVLLILLKALRTKPELRFFALFAFLTSGIVLLGRFARMYVLPQPDRYHIAMDMALCLVIALSIPHATRRIPRRVAGVLLALLVLAAAVQARQQIRYGRSLTQSVAIETTAPYKIAKFADAHLNGQRIFVGGAYGSFFNDFTDTPQMTGGHEPMQLNFLMRSVPYQIYSGSGAGPAEGEVAVLWLKAFGTHAISVPGPASQEYYKPFVNPAKFGGILPVLWREGGDTIYGVPMKSPSLAHVVPSAALVRTMPTNGIDLDQVKVYVSALEDPGLPEATWSWTSRHSGVIHANLARGQLVSLQETYTPGWRATLNGAPREVRADGLGLIAIEPQCEGDCTLTLSYDGGAEWRNTCLASAAVTLLALVLILADIRRKPAAAKSTGDI